MKIEEFYASIDGDYEGVMSRLMNEAMIGRFILKFLDDLSYDNLKTTLLNEDYKEAFRAAHTLKGVSQNLGFTKLYEADAELTERLRGAQDGEARDFVNILNSHRGGEFTKSFQIHKEINNQ